MPKTPQIGAHVSTAGGLPNAIVNGTLLGVEAIQIFGSSPRQWFTRMPAPAEVEQFKKAWQASPIKSVWLHASYLVNLASPDKIIWTKSLKALTEHFRLANLLGANGLIFHTGSAGESPKKEAIAKVAEGMSLVLDAVKGETKLMLENSAGGGNKIGNVPDDIAAMLKLVDSNRAAVCLDTAHAFEAGIIESYSPANVKKFFDEWDKKIGLERVLALHANDSMSEFNSNHDRHENIGKGHIGLAGFQALAKEKRIAHTAWLLEVPGYDGLGPDKKNVVVLKSCFK